MAKKTKEMDSFPSGSESKRDKLAQELADIINKESKDMGKVAFFLDDEDSSSNITKWVSTGIDELDFKISNRKNGGLPVGRITEIQGWEGAGKSLIAANLIVSTQKQGGLPILFDTESAISREFLTAIGVDFSNITLIENIRTVEDVFDRITLYINRVREKDSNRLLTIIVDSLTALLPKNVAAAEYQAEGYGTEKAKLLSTFFAKLNPTIANMNVCLVFTNQLREKVGVMGFGAEKSTTSGGKALGFYATVRIKVAAVGKIKDKANEVIGVQTEATIFKNRCGPPHRKSKFMIYFESGTDNAESWIDVMKTHEISTGAKKPHTYKTDSGEQISLTKQTVKKIIKDGGPLKEEIYNKISTALIKEYKTYDEEVTIEEVPPEGGSDEE